MNVVCECTLYVVFFAYGTMVEYHGVHFMILSYCGIILLLLKVLVLLLKEGGT